MSYFSHYRYLKTWLDEEDSKKQMTGFMHVSIQDAYQQTLHELFAMEEKFYKVFDARNLNRCPTGKDWSEFAVPGRFIFLNKDQKLIIYFPLLRAYQNAGHNIFDTK
jgi:hypothetical protein